MKNFLFPHFPIISQVTSHTAKKKIIIKEEGKNFLDFDQNKSTFSRRERFDIAGIEFSSPSCIHFDDLFLDIDRN